MSFQQQLQQKRAALQATTTIVTTPTGARYMECSNSNSSSASVPVKLKPSEYGFVVDTKPDTLVACILSDFLYLGSQDAVNVENIRTHHLTHILSIGIETPHLAPGTVQCKFVPCLDLPETSLFAENGVVQQGVTFLEDVRRCGGRVLVHCNAGVSRSASVVIAYLMQLKSRPMGFEEAYNLVKSKRECIQPNAGFMRQLKEQK